MPLRRKEAQRGGVPVGGRSGVVPRVTKGRGAGGRGGGQRPWARWAGIHVPEVQSSCPGCRGPSPHHFSWAPSIHLPDPHGDTETYSWWHQSLFCVRRWLSASGHSKLPNSYVCACSVTSIVSDSLQSHGL